MNRRGCVDYRYIVTDNSQVEGVNLPVLTLDALHNAFGAQFHALCATLFKKLEY